jgi:TPR repeat protein
MHWITTVDHGLEKVQSVKTFKEVVMRNTILMLLLAVVSSSAWAEDAPDPADPFGVIKYSLPYAEKGIVPAQLTVASTYYYGKNAPQDYGKALKWFRLAAQQGDATAQNFLGVMYLNAQGVPKDLVRAHMWSNLAAASSKPGRMLTEAELKQMHDELAKQMTPQQVADAQKMGKDCLANNYKGCD